MAFAPAVIVRHHGERRIAHLRLPRQLGLLQVGHADHIRPPAPIQPALRPCRELRPLHTHIRSAQLADHPHLLASLLKRLRHHRAHRIAKGHMRHHALPKKRPLARKRPIDKLIRNHEVHRFMLFLQTPHRRHGQDVLHAQHLHPVNVRAKVQLARQNPVPTPMPRQKRHPPPIELTHHVRVRRRPKRRLDHLLLQPRQPGHRVQPAAANNPNLNLLHTAP